MANAPFCVQLQSIFLKRKVIIVSNLCAKNKVKYFKLMKSNEDKLNESIITGAYALYFVQSISFVKAGQL